MTYLERLINNPRFISLTEQETSFSVQMAAISVGGNFFTHEDKTIWTPTYIVHILKPPIRFPEPEKWIRVEDRLPDESIGRVWCYIEEQTDLGLSHYQWNCSYNPNDGGFDRFGVTHWQPLPEPPIT
jgi:hypothetical protein